MSPYCSSACCTAHKESCPALVNGFAAESTINLSPDVTHPIDKQLSEMVLPDNAAVSVKSFDGELVFLQSQEKEGMMQSQELRSMLRSKRLRDDIMLVDSSKDRQAALKALRARNPEFNSFVDVMLKCVGAEKVN